MRRFLKKISISVPWKHDSIQIWNNMRVAKMILLKGVSKRILKHQKRTLPTYPVNLALMPQTSCDK